jgi:hypothetical protein
MPTKTYALDAGQTELITVRWSWPWRKFTVLQHEQVLGQLRTQAELEQGAAFALADGRTLSARLQRKIGGPQLELLLDGQPLPSSATHPRQLLGQGLGVLGFLAVVNVVLGLLAELGQVEVLLRLGLGYGSAAVGGVYGLLWVWAKRRLVPAAFYVAIGLLALDLVAILALSPGNSPGSTSGLFMRFFFALLLYRGSQGARQLRAERAAETAPLAQ